jgi:radical SAM superfamily enzyme YgiQ (UPF0313 family)
MKIFLVNLPWERQGRWGVRAGSRWPHIKTVQERNYLPYPFFLAYAAALLQREGFEVRLIDSLAIELSVKDFLAQVEREKPDLLVAETSTPSLLGDFAIIDQLPRGLPVALCGPESNIRDPQFMAAHRRINYVFVGEYECTLLELAQCLSAGKPVDDILGLIFQENGQFKVNPSRPLMEDLDYFPWPLREGLPMDKYNDTPGGIPAPSVQMWSTRGCPYQCVFCIWPQLMYEGRRYRTRSVKDVVDEMECMVRTKGFKSVYFDDDTANIGRLRMMELAREIKRRELNIPWAMMARADVMEEDVLKELRSAGLMAVKYGVESSNQQLLDNIQKGMDLRKTERMIRFTKQLGIKTHLTFSFGLPGETRDTIQKTIDFALDLDPDSLQFSINTAFPGTKYFDELEQKGHVVSKNLSDYDGNRKAMLRTEALSGQDLIRAKRRADRIWQEHVWKTRPQDHGPQRRKISWERLASALEGHHPWAAVTKTVSFAGSQCSRQLARLKQVALSTDWEKVKKNYLNLLGVHHGSAAFKGPDCVQIDLTSKCNNNCVSCWCNSPLLGDKMYAGSKKFKTLPTQLAISVIDELADLGTKELFFSGGGEPFMHPDLLLILEHAKARGMFCTVNTNFTIMNEKIIQRLIDLSIDALTVSFWAATPESYVLTHPTKDEATFHRMTANLKMLNALKGDRGPVVKIYNVISNLNYMDVARMVDFADETGSETVEFTVVDTIPGATDQLILDAAQRQNVLDQCARIAGRQYKVRVLGLEQFVRRVSDAGAANAQYDSGLLGHSSCYIGWVFSRIMSDGDVNFCLKAHRVPVGNIYKNSFREIWNSSRQKEFRQKAVRFDKNDPFFQMIGNDEKCKMGCYKSCDNLGWNVNVQQKMDALTPLEKTMLKFVSRFKK